MEILKLLWPTAAVVAFSLSGVAVRRWWQIRRNRESDGEQAVALAPLAAELDGEVLGVDRATAWSADVLGPLARHVDGVVDKFLQRSKPRFDLAMDFQRGPWHVRVSQASMRQQNSNGVGRLLEHRFEAAMPLRLPPEAGQEFTVYANDLSSAARAFNSDAVDWLLVQVDALPSLIGRFLSLTFEDGDVHTTVHGSVDEGTVLPVVDTICGLLDRMPGVRPRHPAPTT